MNVRALIVLIGMLPAVAGARDFWPGVDYDPAIPDFSRVLGYEPGERISDSTRMLRYFEALQAAAPDRVRIADYARSWQGRRLIWVVIGQPERMARLDEHRAAMQALADPRVTDETEARRLIAETAGSTWLSYSVHGNEISSTDAAMLTAYHLLAASNDPVVDRILAETLVFIDPLQNPDGRDRFVHAFEQARGLLPDPDRYSAEHDEPWPSGRVNHYTFDLNRDWLALTQPETRGRVGALLDWLPLVFIDAHEMGGDSTYYFTPEAVPYNPFIHPDQRDSLTLIGRNNARWFDRFGFDYFTREEYDAFYPGYGASWPLFFGAIAATYEQASTRGLVWRQASGRTLSYADAVRHHFVASISTAEVVAQNRVRLLENFHAYRRDGIESGRKGSTREILIPADPDPSMADKLAGLMVEHGVEVRRAVDGFEACGRRYPAGSYAISLAQPSYRFIRTVLDPQVDMETTFLEEQERRRDKNIPDEIYDVTAWSLPLMFNQPVDRCGRTVSGDFERAGPERFRPGRLQGDGQVAYLVPWGTRAAGRLLAAALRAGLSVDSSDKAFVHQGREFPSGTLIFKAARNAEGLGSRLADLASTTGAEVMAVADSWVERGPNFGSENVVTVPAPRIAMLWDRPAGTYSAGQTRFVLERQFGYPVTAIRGEALARADLSRYDVLILPDGGGWADYETVLGEAAAQHIAHWVEAGGTLVLLADAVDWAAGSEVGLSDLQREAAWRDDDPPAAQGEEGGDLEGTLITSEADYRRRLEPREEPPDGVAGVLVRARVDRDHWLSAGLGERLNVLVRGDAIHAPLSLDQGRNVVRFESADALLASGYLWEENRRQLAFKPFVAVQELGRGLVIAFTQDPNYRAYLDGLNVLFLNAVFRGPAHARALR